MPASTDHHNSYQAADEKVSRSIKTLVVQICLLDLQWPERNRGVGRVLYSSTGALIIIEVQLEIVLFSTRGAPLAQMTPLKPIELSHISNPLFGPTNEIPI